jgi:hypothetical protein
VHGRVTLNITGKIDHFALMKPAFARLVGKAGTEIKKTITITREKDYPFKILKVKARKGKDFVFDLKEFSENDTDGYLLTIENRKMESGRYADKLTLTTDSSIKPTITVPVYGQIHSTEPAKKNTPSTSSTQKSTEG